MLVLTRKKNEAVVIDDVIVVTVVEIRGDKVRLGFDSPRLIEVQRQETYEQIHGKSRSGLLPSPSSPPPPPAWQKIMPILEKQYLERKSGLDSRNPADWSKEIIRHLPPELKEDLPGNLYVIYVDPADRIERLTGVYALPFSPTGMIVRSGISRPDRPYVVFLEAGGSAEDPATVKNPLLDIEVALLSVVCPTVLDSCGLTAAGNVYGVRTSLSLMKISGRPVWVLHEGHLPGCLAPVVKYIA